MKKPVASHAAVIAAILAASSCWSVAANAMATTVHAGRLRATIGQVPRPPVHLAATAPAPWPMPTKNIIDHGPRRGMRIALTFDADMTRGMVAQLRSGSVARWFDPALMRELRDTRTPATVFMTGMWAEQYPKLARRIAVSPYYEIENHSYDHKAWTSQCYGLPQVTPHGKLHEIRHSAQRIRQIAGIAVHYFRYPGGCHSAADNVLVQRAGEQALGWDVVSGDAFQPSPNVIVHQVLSQARPGSIVVMHFMGGPNAPATGRAVRQIIPALRRRGYTLVTLRQLLAH